MQSKQAQKMAGEEKEVVRDECFRKWETPFRLEQHYVTSIMLILEHVFGIGYFVLMWSGIVKKNTFIFEFLYGVVGALGITVGCHRYWSHKTFKANIPLQVLLMIMQTIAAQYPIHKWCLDHRIHHKYTDTNCDPHNSKRGFWFSHMSWLYLPKHPDLKEKLKTFPMPDLENDPIVRFQSKWYTPLVIIFNFAIPISFIYYYYELPLLYAVACNYRRYLCSLHFTFLVNSVAHKWGDKPYDKNISPVDNAIVAFLSAGEGWHNYHHTFPWDYKASEFGWKLNPSTMFIDFFAWLGWASEMKTVSQKLLRQRLRRTGDGTHVDSVSIEDGDETENDFGFHVPPDVSRLMGNIDHPIWGWDDDALTNDFKNFTKILYSD